MIDWAVIGTGLGALATNAITYFMTKGKRKAADAVDIAVADAESTLYNRLRERLDALEGDVTKLRGELDTERKHGRKLERHIWRLEGLMRKAGVEPPPFDDDEMKPGGTD